MKVCDADNKGEHGKQSEQNPYDELATGTFERAGGGFGAESNRDCVLNVSQASTEAVAKRNSEGRCTKGCRGRQGEPKLPEKGARWPDDFLQREAEDASEEKDEARKRCNRYR